MVCKELQINKKQERWWFFFKMQNINRLFSEETQKTISKYVKSCSNLLIIRGIQDFLKLWNNSLHPFNGEELGSWVLEGLRCRGRQEYLCLIENNLVSWSNQYCYTLCPLQFRSWLSLPKKRDLFEDCAESQRQSSVHDCGVGVGR